MDIKKNMSKKELDYYLNLPWTYTIEQAKDEQNKKIYIVRVNELPGVSTDAPSIEEAMSLIQEAMTLAFEMYLKSGEEIPEPISEENYKGKIAYRTTARRHYIIAKEAKKNNLSLSQVIDNLIDTAILGKK